MVHGFDVDEREAYWAPSIARRRGDRRRQAIVDAMRQLMEEMPFSELSVSTISKRAKVARSGFYFYFESKYSVLAQILAEAADELEELTQYFAPRPPGESPEEFAHRMVQSAALVYAHNDPIMTACNAARHQDAEVAAIVERLFQELFRAILGLIEAEVAAGTVKPISDDVPTLVRTLLAMTALSLTGDPFVVGRQDDIERRMRLLEDMWVGSFWGSAAT
jgi:AcrR family transcriptional regulator